MHRAWCSRTFHSYGPRRATGQAAPLCCPQTFSTTIVFLRPATTCRLRGGCELRSWLVDHFWERERLRRLGCSRPRFARWHFAADCRPGRIFPHHLARDVSLRATT